jgi:hypothetical protein
MSISTNTHKNFSGANNTYLHISYVNDYQIDQDGNLYPVFAKKRFVKKNVKKYANHSHLLVDIRPRTRIVLDLITEKMDHSNRIENTKAFKQDILKFFKSKCNIKAESTAFIDKAFQELKNQNILLYSDSPGMERVYYVNPKYYFKGSEKERQALLGSLIASGRTYYSKKIRSNFISLIQ